MGGGTCFSQMTTYPRYDETRNCEEQAAGHARALVPPPQEPEAVSRNAKIEWCDTNGIQVLNLQHDGMVGFGMPAGMDSGVDWWQRTWQLPPQQRMGTRWRLKMSSFL
jgi:hypothetical protein